MQYMESKEYLREKYLTARSEISQSKINKWSQKIKNNFLKLPQLTNVKKIMAYASMRNEIKTFPLMKELLIQNYLLYLPYTIKEINDLGVSKIKNLNSELEKGVYGVQEPISKIRGNEIPSDIDLIIIPGACFSLSGYRIGYGGGYYDRFLSKHAENALKVGFCYEQFILNSIPAEEHDIPVDIIITENEIIKVN